MYNRETHVDVYPFTRQTEGEQVIVGRVETGTFLALPLEALEVLDELAAGKTVGEAQDVYYDRHGEVPELEEFLSLLETKGLVWPRSRASLDRPSAEIAPPPAAPRLRYHFENFPESLARKLFGRTALSAFGVLTALVCGALVFSPSLLPGSSALYFPEHRTLSIFLLMTLSYMSLFFHELGHLVAARAVGVKSRMGIGHRLWYLVAETDLTGLWAVPKRKRYLPLLAGMMIDVACSDILLLFLWAESQGWVTLPLFLLRLVQALIFTFLMRLLWQFFLFLRTDIYYVIASLFNCKSLLKDTENYLRNRLAKLSSLVSPVDQAGIPEVEMNIVRRYASIWLIGRIMATFVLLLITIPLTIRYFSSVAATLRVGFAVSPYRFVDSLILALYPLIPLTIGMTLWIRSILRRIRS